MDKTTQLKLIDIRPSPSVYSTYRRLSYKTWFALAEFIDNSTQNYYSHEKDLIQAYSKEQKGNHLKIQISYDSERNQIEILDNANGMDFEELGRAVALDKPPKDRSGRSEFGMGLKTAACWFGTTWEIETSKLGIPFTHFVKVHVPDLVENSIKDIPVKTISSSKTTHFTKITISGLFKPIHGRTLGRVKDQIGSIYREDIRSGKIDISWNGEPVKFDEPPILIEKNGPGSETIWKKKIDFNVKWENENKTLKVSGWIGIRLPGSQRDAGYVLLRRGRVIIGGPNEGYKPIEIFGQGNTFRSQRLIGELHMDEWPVTQAKDDFDWAGGLEESFIASLKTYSQDYMDKAEGHRKETKPITKADMEMATEETQKAFSSPTFGNLIKEEIDFPLPHKTEKQNVEDSDKLKEISEGPILFKIPVGTEIWEFKLHWQGQISDAHWMSVNYPSDNETNIFLNTSHPFFVKYLDKPGALEILQNIILSLALAERMARRVKEKDCISPDDFRNYMNRVLRRVGEMSHD